MPADGEVRAVLPAHHGQPSAIISARTGYPWPRIPSRILSHVRPGFTSTSRGSLWPPPGLCCLRAPVQTGRDQHPVACVPAEARAVMANPAAQRKLTQARIGSTGPKLPSQRTVLMFDISVRWLPWFRILASAEAFLRLSWRTEVAAVAVINLELWCADLHRRPLHGCFARGEKDGNQEKNDDTSHLPAQAVSSCRRMIFSSR